MKLGAATCAADKVPSVWQIAVTHIAGDVALEQRRRGIAGKNRGDIRGQKNRLSSRETEMRAPAGRHSITIIPKLVTG